MEDKMIRHLWREVKAEVASALPETATLHHYDYHQCRFEFLNLEDGQPFLYALNQPLLSLIRHGVKAKFEKERIVSGQTDEDGIRYSSRMNHKYAPNGMYVKILIQTHRFFPDTYAYGIIKDNTFHCLHGDWHIGYEKELLPWNDDAVPVEVINDAIHQIINDEKRLITYFFDKEASPENFVKVINDSLVGRKFYDGRNASRHYYDMSRWRHDKETGHWFFN